MLRVHSIETFGTHEGPGIRLVVFLQGCNFRCLYCHNPDTHDINGGYNLAFKKIVEMAKEQEHYFHEKGGITVSGGEPLLQSEKLTQFFKALKKRNIHTALDTNGSILNEEVKKLLQYTDLVILDIKHINPDSHKEITGTDNKEVFKFAKYLKKINKNFWLRLVLVPELTSKEMHLQSVGEYFKDYSNLERVEILPYHSLGVYKYKAMEKKYELENVPMTDEKTKKQAKQILQRYFKDVHVR